MQIFRKPKIFKFVDFFYHKAVLIKVLICFRVMKFTMFGQFQKLRDSRVTVQVSK